MKENTKHLLKQINRLLKIGVLTFAWLMACVGVTAYSIYWLRQNANYEQEINNRSIKPKKVLNNASFDNSYFITRDKSFYDTINYVDTDYDFIDFEPNIIVSQDIRVSFNIELVSNGQHFNRVRIELNRFQSGGGVDYFNFSRIIFSQVDDNVTSYYINIYARNVSSVTEIPTNSFLRDIHFHSNELYSLVGSVTPGISHIDYVSFLKFSFNCIFDNYNSSTYILDFSNPYLNFEQLLSYSRADMYDFIVAGSPFGSNYVIPMLFTYDGILYDALVFSDTYVVSFIDDSQTRKSYQDITGSDTQYLLTCRAVYFQYYGETITFASGTELVPILSGGGIEVAYREIAFYDEGRLGGSGATPNNYPVWNMSKGWNTYGRITYNLIVSNDSLNYIPFVNNDSSVAHYPIENIRVRDILDYITSYHDDGYFNINSDIGLGGVFTLVKGAFGGLIGLMTIQILPGLTLGLLIFTPLILTIIIVILRLVKK